MSIVGSSLRKSQAGDDYPNATDDSWVMCCCVALDGMR